MIVPSPKEPTRWPRARLELAFAATSAALLVARLYAASVLGFGDAEALYATYVAHPAAAYVDHPGLIAVLGALAGGGAPPTPRAAHVWTAILATAVPVLAWGSARLAGAPRRRAAIAALVLALCPELAIGLFGLTPDLPFAIFTLLCIGAVCAAVRAPRDDYRGDLAVLAAGVCAGLATLAKIPGLALLLWVPLATSRRRPAWLVASASALAVLVASPLLAHERAHGFPMLLHRFVHTQESAGFSLRNVGALLGGQLLYVSPFVVAAAWVSARALPRAARRDPVNAALGLLALGFGLPLGLLCLWSRVAEPHWLAPAYLPLLIAWARLPARASFASGIRRPLLPVCATLVLLVHAYVLTDLFPRFAGRTYEGRYDLANDMRMFPAAGETLRAALRVAQLRGPSLVVVAPHWTLAAQLATVLPPGTRITTAGPLARDDDFARWVPPQERDTAAILMIVHDDRFAEIALPELTKGRTRESATRFSLQRGGRAVRTLDVQTFGAARALGAISPELAPH